MAKYTVGKNYYYKSSKENKNFTFLGELLDITHKCETQNGTDVYLEFKDNIVVYIKYITGTFKEINEKCLFTEEEYKIIKKDETMKTYDLRAYDISEIMEMVKGYRDCTIILNSWQGGKLPPTFFNYMAIRGISIEITEYPTIFSSNNYVSSLDFRSDLFKSAVDTTGVFNPNKNYYEPKKIPTNVFFNDKKKATTLMFDENATVVKCGKDDEYSRRIGFLEAYFQATCGLSKTQAKKYLDKIVKDKEVKDKDEVNKK